MVSFTIFGHLFQWTPMQFIRVIAMFTITCVYTTASIVILIRDHRRAKKIGSNRPQLVTVLGKPAILYESPRDTSKVITVIPTGTMIHTFPCFGSCTIGNYTRVTYNDNWGYVHTDSIMFYNDHK